jgi:hypothetical protein
MSVNIPNSVKYIGGQAFDGCSNLRKLYVYSEHPPTKEHSFYNMHKKTTLYVPAAAIPLYQATAGWKKFYNIKAIRCSKKKSKNSSK